MMGNLITKKILKINFLGVLLTPFQVRLTMKVYIASCMDNKVMIEVLANEIKQVDGLEVIGNWWSSEVPLLDDIRQIAKMDLGDISKSDVLVGIYPYGFGTVAELGYALGLGKTVLYLYPSGWESEHPLPVGLLPEENIFTTWVDVKLRLKELAWM